MCVGSTVHDGGDLLSEGGSHVLGSARFPPAERLLGAVDEPERGRHAEIRRQESLFEALERVVIHAPGLNAHVRERQGDDADEYLIGGDVNITTAGGVGALGALETAIDTLTIRAGSGIGINERDAIEVLDVRSTADAPTSGIALTAGGDVNIDVLVAGDDTFGGANPAQFADVRIETTGAIEERGNDPAIDIRADDLTMIAGDGIGALGALELSANSIAADAGAGFAASNRGGDVVALDVVSGGNVFFEQFAANRVDASRVVAGGTALNLQVHDSGELNLFGGSSGGDARLQADQMDLPGPPGSFSGPGTLTVLADNPAIYVQVNPFGQLEDFPGTLEFGLDDIKAAGFPLLRFLGKVTVMLPVILDEGGSSGGGGEDARGRRAFEDDDHQRARQVVDFEGDGEVRDLSGYFADNFGYQPFALAGFGPAFGDLMGRLSVEDGWLLIFQSVFGFSPYAWSGIGSDFLDQLLAHGDADGGQGDGQAPAASAAEQQVVAQRNEPAVLDIPAATDALVDQRSGADLASLGLYWIALLPSALARLRARFAPRAAA